MLQLVLRLVSTKMGNNNLYSLPEVLVEDDSAASGSMLFLEWIAIIANARDKT